MPITRSRTSSEQSAPEVVVGEVATGGDKETVVKDLKAAVVTPVAETIKAKDDTTNGCTRVATSEADKPLCEEKTVESVADAAEAKAAPVAGDADGDAATVADKETAVLQKEEEAGKNGIDPGSQAADAAAAVAAAPANGCSRSAVTDSDKTSEVEKDVNEVQEAEAKDTSGEVCAKRKTEESEVSGEADSTCKKNKVDTEAADPVASC